MARAGVSPTPTLHRDDESSEDRRTRLTGTGHVTPTRRRRVGVKLPAALVAVAMGVGALAALLGTSAGVAPPSPVVTSAESSMLQSTVSNVLGSTTTLVGEAASALRLTAPKNPPSSTTPTTTPAPSPAVSASGTYSGSSFPLASVAPGANNAGCGTTQVLKPNGQPWTCSFDDEFNGTSLNTNVWTPQVTADSGYVAGDDCYVDNPQTVNESGGMLNLSVYDSGSALKCGLYSSRYLAGMVTTYAKFDQTYGLYEIRAKIPNTTTRGLQETFWLWPQNPTYGPGNANSGEIDYAEFYTEYNNLDVPYVHYAETKSDPNVTAYNCTINPGQFNTYGLLWTSTTIQTMVNGQVCTTDTWLPTPGDPAGAPFNQPFFLALTQAMGQFTNEFEPGKTPLPATTSIDWMRVWQ
jgi:beta-glucanase (GH16 family)